MSKEHDDIQRSLDGLRTAGTEWQEQGTYSSPQRAERRMRQLYDDVLKPERKRTSKKKYPIAFLVPALLIVSGLVGAASMQLFSQSLPGPSTAVVLFTGGCQTTASFPSTATQPALQAGALTWDCVTGSTHTAAFTSNVAGTAYASFSLTGFSSLFIIPHQAPVVVVDCYLVPGQIGPLVSGSAGTIALTASASWDYCADYNVGATGLAVGTVTWTQVTP